MEMLKSLFGLTVQRTEDVKWGSVNTLVVATEREYRYWQKKHNEQRDEVGKTGNRRQIEEWTRGPDMTFNLAREIRKQLIANGWVPAKERDDDWHNSKVE